MHIADGVIISKRISTAFRETWYWWETSSTINIDERPSFSFISTHYNSYFRWNSNRNYQSPPFRKRII
jgi:hypothetical protein